MASRAPRLEQPVPPEVARRWLLAGVPAAVRAAPEPVAVDPMVVLRDIATGKVPGSPAQVRAAIEVLNRTSETPVAPAEEYDFNTPEGEAALLEDLVNIPTRLLLEALERQGVAPMVGRAAG